METKLIPISESAPEEAALEEACALLRAGGIVAVPTETVYGLAANALDGAAVGKIFAAKGRPQDNPLIVHIADMHMLSLLAREIPPAALELARRFWPGPLTIVLPKTERVPLCTSGGLDTVGIRMPSHPVMRALIRRCGLPLAAPSANLSGTPSTTTAAHCVSDLCGRVDAILCGGDCALGLESTVVSLACDPPRLLRPGAVTYEQLCETLHMVEVDPAVSGPALPGQAPGAPGMKYKHYAPQARVVLLLGESAPYCAYVNAHADSGTQALCFEGEESSLNVPAIASGTAQEPSAMAHTLFGALRDFDRKGVQTVFAHCPEPKGMGLAVYNRLIRAAAFDVIRL